VAGGVEQVRAAVAEHADRGVDLVKVMASGGMVTEGSDVMGVQFTPEELAAGVEAAHARGLRLVAHAHSLAGARHAVQAGVDGIEHFSCLTDDGSVTPDDLLEEIAGRGIVVDPTAGIDQARVPPPDRLPPLLRSTLERLGLDFKTLPKVRAAQLTRAREHGVTVVTGTDAGIAPTKAHGGVWRAVLDLLDAGYSMEAALATATSGAADVFGLSEATGRLRNGLAADLLVVDGDLSRDPQALGRPVAVLVRGIPAQAS
jgi:imidazolonepropionase-like amidohydrolase